MSFIHHSPKPLRQSELRDGNQDHATDFGAKPDGLWFSVGDGADWRNLVQIRYNPRDVTYWTELVFSESANFLRLGDTTGLDEFTTKYARIRSDGRQSIDWHSVAEQFAGIIIPLVSHLPWHKCWEVPSGCVWQAKAIEYLRPLNYQLLKSSR